MGAVPSGRQTMAKKMRLHVFGIITLLWGTAVYGQGPDTLWAKVYGERNYGDVGYSVQQTPDGGFIIAGSTIPSAPGWSDVYLIKTDPNGDTLWTRTYGGSNEDVGYAVQQTSDGGYVIAGRTLSSGPGWHEAYVIKTDGNGDTLWTRTFGGSAYEAGRSVREVSPGGGYIIAGATGSFSVGGYDVYLIRTDANGDSLWMKTYGGMSNDRAYSLGRTSDGGYIVAGYTGSFGAGGYDVYLVRTDENGDSLWTRTFGGTENDDGRSVQETSNGGYIVAGHTESFGAGGYDVYLVRTDENGDSLWTRTYGGARSDHGYSVQQTLDGGYIIGGDIGHPETNREDVYLIKTGEDCSGIGEADLPKPTLFASRGSPNPFSVKTRIEYFVPGSLTVRVRIINLLGQEVRTLLVRQQNRGKHEIFWDGKDNSGQKASSGHYLVSFEAGSHTAATKVLLIK
jgi:regulation of enolase protein 1 (concanavalin A-like superfamily)